MKVSISEVQSFLSCRRKWDWGSPNRRNLQPIGGDASGDLWLGTGIHAALETWYAQTLPNVRTPRAAVPLQLAFEKWLATDGERADGDPDVLQDKRALGVVMLSEYAATYGSDPFQDRDSIRFLATEQSFDVPIPGTNAGRLVGTTDGLIRDRDGLLWIIDHKTYTAATSEDVLARSFQFLAYTYAFNVLARTGALDRLPSYAAAVASAPNGALRTVPLFVGTVYNGLRKAIPNGSPRQAALFQRLWIPYNGYQLRAFEQHLTAIYREMTRTMLPIYPRPDWGCARCAFRVPCYHADMGGDSEYELRAGYQPAPSRGAVYDAAPEGGADGNAS